MRVLPNNCLRAWIAQRWLVALFAVITCSPLVMAAPVASPPEPAVVGTFPENEADVVRLPDDTLKVFYNQRNEYVGSLTSRDHGKTWSEPQKEFAVSGKTAHAMQVLLDPAGELHVFYLVIVGTGRKLNVDLFLDLWQCSTVDGRERWSEPRQVYHGAIGALRGLVQMKSGRIVLPFSTAAAGRPPGPPTGNFYTTAIVSDDLGKTWVESKAELTSPCTEGYNGGNYGAVEPTIIQLKDGRLWMLIRTQTGKLYESYSSDGLIWSTAAPSQFYSSNSPAMFRRLDDGRLFLAWNNAQIQPRVDGQGVYSGRDALHAAISADDGKTWQGFREVYRDPTRHESSELRNDRATAYPDAVQTADGMIVLVTGQGEKRRAIVRLSPDWITATHREDDFAQGIEGWTAFQEFGPAQRFWRARRLGGQLLPHPDHADRQILAVGRRDELPGAGAVWNFAAGRQGTLAVKVRTGDNFGGAQLALTDRLFAPADANATGEGLFAVDLHTRKEDPTGFRITPNQWHELKLKWDTDKGECRVMLGDREQVLTMRSQPTLGISYLALRSLAVGIDESGLMIERVAVDIANR